MLSKKLIYLGLTAVTASGLFACQGQNDGANTANVGTSNAVESEAAASAAEYEITGMTVNKTDAELAAIYAEYPALAHSVSELDAATGVNETTSNKVELVAGAARVIELTPTDSSLEGAMTVTWSRSAFEAEAVNYSIVAADQDQNPAHGSLVFNLESCKEEQGQEQEQTGKEEPGKEEPGQEQGQDEKGKVEDKGEKGTETCETIVVTITFEGEEEVKQEQEQKEEPAKEEPAKQEQDDKGQDDKGQDDKGQDDKGQDDKGQDDKKEEPAKEEPAKQEQEQEAKKPAQS